MLGVSLGIWLWDVFFEDELWRPPDGVSWWLIVVPPLAALAIESVLYLCLRRPIRKLAERAPARSVLLVLALGPIAWLAYTGIAGAVFLAADATRGGTEFKAVLGTLGSLSAAATTLGLTGVSRAPAEGGKGLASYLFALLGGYLLLLVLIVLLSWGLWELYTAGPHSSHSLDFWFIDADLRMPWPFVGVTSGAALLVIVFAFFVKNERAAWLLNRLSIHDVYRERITQTWVISANPAPWEVSESSVHRWSRVWSRSKLSVSDLAVYPPAAPYPLICATINIPGSRGQKLPERKGDSFLFAPLYCGSASTRWVATGRGEFEYSRMPVGRAATISGAAFSPNMGEKSNRTFSILMTIFNARIGRWCDNPRTDHRRQRSALKLYHKELFANPSRDDHQVYLSDGGHFENFGLYELIRRRCKYVIAVSADTEKQGRADRHGNLADATRMVREDFGVQIEMPNMVPITRDKDGGVLSSYAVGRLLYPKARKPDGTPEWEEGILVVIKTGMIPAKMSVDLLNHWRKNPDFPYTGTMDQQFDQGQFEAYRQLGYLAGRAVGQAAGPAELGVGLRFSQVRSRFEADFPLA
jgi:hypothetical protein